MQATDEDVLDQALDWIDEGHRVALATVVQTWGSSPRPSGSPLAVRDDGLFVGSVSGGCVEGKVVEAAQAAIQDGGHRLLEFGVSNEEAWEVGLACGGTVRIYVEPVKSSDAAPSGPMGREVLEAVRVARRDHRAIVLVTPLDGKTVRAWSPGEAPLPDDLRGAAERALATDAGSVVETGSGAVFVQALNPPLKLVIVGAVHIAEPLSRLGVLLGYEVILIDPREAFARSERWPGVTVKNDWPDEVLGAMNLDARTAVVALTHDPKIDDPALVAALKSPAFYVGALGSGKTHASRLRRLGEQGLSAQTLARIHGPIGLKIGARSPGEIAVSIAAQMTETLRRGTSSSPSP
jgi:xanthine dehydrogenase accessory factor